MKPNFHKKQQQETKNPEERIEIKNQALNFKSQ